MKQVMCTVRKVYLYKITVQISVHTNKTWNFDFISKHVRHIYHVYFIEYFVVMGTNGSHSHTNKIRGFRTDIM